MASDTNKQVDRDPGATGEFFTVGSPLHAVKAAYIPRQADELLVEAVNAGRYVAVLSPHRTGKSSLIAGASLRIESDAVRVATIDLAQISTRETESAPGRWYYNFAYRLLRQLRIRFDLQEWWQDKSMLSNGQRLLDFYSEIVLAQVSDRIVVFVDSLELIGHVDVGEALLSSIRAAHDARAMDPDFTRLTFVMVGDCDQQQLVADIAHSPFQVAQSIHLPDFEREQLDPYLTELNLPADEARKALDRIYYWTSGHPYLTQKLARAVSRMSPVRDVEVEEAIEGIVKQQFSGRAATENEPHLSHIQRQVTSDRHREAMLNLYGRIRKGVNVATDLGAAAQRRLLSIGLLELTEAGDLKIRNRIYEAVFTARWANENLPTRFRFYFYAAAVIVAALAIPFWYTQLLPGPYVAVLTAGDTTLEDAQTAWLNFRSFPGHGDSANSVYRRFLVERAAATDDEIDILKIASMATALAPNEGLDAQLTAAFWDRRARRAIRGERRDEALLAAIRSFASSSRPRRNRAAMLVGGDYPLLRQTLKFDEASPLYFDNVNRVFTRLDEARVSQWRMTADTVERRDDWELSTLDIEPLVRRVAVNASGDVRRIGLTLTISHPRFRDLFLRLTAPSGKSVTLSPDVDTSSSIEEIRIPADQLRPLIGESMKGTWSLSIRDQSPGVGGHLLGWDLRLNGQGLVEELQRGLNIPNPVEATAAAVWVDERGRYAAARSRRGDSVQLWDLAFARPLGAIAAYNNESLIGLDAEGRVFVTATRDVVHLWDVASGKPRETLEVAAEPSSLQVLPDSARLFVRRPGNGGSEYEVWSLEDAERLHAFSVDILPLDEVVSGNGRFVALADYDRSVRVFDLQEGELVAQVNLSREPERLELSYGGESLAVVYRDAGVALWALRDSPMPVYEEFAPGDWLVTFSSGGDLFVAGKPGEGFRLRRARDGSPLGPLFDADAGAAIELLALTRDAKQLVTPSAGKTLRVWDAPLDAGMQRSDEHPLIAPALDMPLHVTADASLLLSTDRDGHLHSLLLDSGRRVAGPVAEDLSFIAHSQDIRSLAVADGARRAATLGGDDVVRFWRLDDGLPGTADAAVAADAVVAMRFSPSGQELGILTDDRLLMIDADSGLVTGSIEFIESPAGFDWLAETRVFIGMADGALKEYLRRGESAWSGRTIWKGEAGIELLRHSPDGRLLVLADTASTLYQFDLESADMVGQPLSLPSMPRDLVFAPRGPTVYVRTSRWVHRLAASSRGLLWRDAMHVPAVAGNGSLQADGNDAFLLPVSEGGVLRLARYSFADGEASGLFGSMDELYRDWSTRLGLAD